MIRLAPRTRTRATGRKAFLKSLETPVANPKKKTPGLRSALERASVASMPTRAFQGKNRVERAGPKRPKSFRNLEVSECVPGNKSYHVFGLSLNV
jgi:hypothetical protein